MHKRLTAKLLTLSTSAFLVVACGNEEEMQESETGGSDTTEQTDGAEHENTDLSNDDNEADTEDNDGEEETSQESDGETDEGSDEGSDEAFEDETEKGTLAAMSEQEQQDHYRALLADADQSIDEAVFEHMELRGVHENTAAYGGRVKPDSTLELEILNRRADIEMTDDLYVNEDGFFSINLYQYDSIEGDDINLYLSHDDLETEYHFILPVHSSEADMDIIKPLSETDSFEDQLISSLELENVPAVYPNTLNYGGSLGRHLEGFFYSIDQDMKGNAFVQYSQRENSEGDFIIRSDHPPEAGQVITYYAVAEGVIASTEDEVLEMTTGSEEAAERIRHNTDIELSSEMEGDLTLQTIPDAAIDISIPDQWSTRRVSDENGEFELPSVENHIEPDITYLFTIRDENGYTETIEASVE